MSVPFPFSLCSFCLPSFSLCFAVALLSPVAESLAADELLPTIVAGSDDSPPPDAASATLPLIVPAAFDRVAESESKSESKSDAEPASQSAAGTVRKNRKSPASASESASSRAREEWQKQFTASGEPRLPAEKKSSAEKKPAKSRRTKTKTTADTQPAKAKRRKAAQPSPAKPSPAKARLPVVVPRTFEADRYAAVYATIPFSRAEYDADPAYRHNATMELLLKQLRPAAPRVETDIDVTVQPLAPYRYGYPLRSGYRPWSRYPWH